MAPSLADQLRFLLRGEEWMENAACKGMGPEKFFPKRGQSQRPGKAVCDRCPVVEECADYRVRSKSEYGMWGGVLHKRANDPDEETSDDSEKPQRKQRNGVRRVSSPMEGGTSTGREDAVEQRSELGNSRSRGIPGLD